MSKTWFVGGRRQNETINENVYEKVNPKTNKINGMKLSRVVLVFAVDTHQKFLLID